MVRKARLCAIFATLTATGPATAQDPPRPNRDSVYLLPGIEVRATVIGRGHPRGANALDATRIRLAVPAGTSPLRSIDRLPGANVQSADAFGVYEGSTRVTMRGFQRPSRSDRRSTGSRSAT